jgi:hypothetical protein
MNYLTNLLSDLSFNKEINNVENKDNNIKIINEDSNYQLISLDYKTLKENYNIKNWKKNRPADKFRVDEIYEFYLSNKITLLPGILYVWLNKDKYFIYDGIHRYEALKKLNNDNINILLYINLSNNEDSIIEDFTNINKSIPLPSLYTENTEISKIHICQNVAEHLCKKYPKFVSTSRKPHTYNFNRDQIIDFISTFNINFKIKNLDYIIYQILIKLNNHAKNKILENKIIHPIKCKKYNFYLFYLDKSYIKSEVENALKELF